MAKPAEKSDKKAPKADVDPDDFMSKTELKAALAIAEAGTPVPCAIGMTKDKKHGLVLLAKRGRGKSLLDDLTGTADEMEVDLDDGALRYGRVSIKGDMVTFTLKKEAPGALWSPIQKRMLKLGYGKIDMITGAVDDDDAPAPAATAPAAAPAGASAPEATPASAPGPAPGTPTGASPGVPPGTSPGPSPGTSPGTPPGSQSPASPGAPPGAAAAPAPQPAATPQPTEADQARRTKELTATLGALLKRLADVLKITPALKDNLVEMATAAKTALQGGKLDVAADLIETLDNELQAAPTQAQATTGAGADSGAAAAKAQAIAGKAQMAWGACLKIAGREIEKLRAEVVAAYSDHGFGSQVDNFFKSQVDPALQRLQNNDLAAKLAEAAGSTDVTAQRQSLAESIRIIESLENLLATDKVLQKLDANPFTQLVVGKTASATLGTLKKSLQSAAAG